MAKNKKIIVQGNEITIIEYQNSDFISLTDMVKGFEDGLSLIEKWLRNKNTIEFIGVWEELYNPDFNYPEFEGIKNEAGLNRFYHIHTDAIKENLIPAELTKHQINFVCASEADLLNVALFGMTALEWRTGNPDKEGNIRDYANIVQLVVLSNMESINAVLIRQGLSQSKRLVQLNKIAITQMTSLVNSKQLKKLK